MKYQRTINLFTMTEDQIKRIQRGQWVSAGEVTCGKDRGVFCGVKQSGSIVVAWQGNAQSHKDRKGYRKALMNYGKAW